MRYFQLTVIAGWTAAIASLLSLVYGLYDVNLSPATGAAYSALSHSAWALALAWIVVACSTGYGGKSRPIVIFFSFISALRFRQHDSVVDDPLSLQSHHLLRVFAASCRD
jgi:hypothetical protein